jgi:hypothetical protein
MSTDEPHQLEPPLKASKLCYCGKPRPAHEDYNDFGECRRAHQQPKRELYLMDRVITSSQPIYA